MKRSVLYILLAILVFNLSSANAAITYNTLSLDLNTAVSEYETSVTFPAGYLIGDYIEFVRVNPYDAGASGFYQISVSYTRNSVASAATHLASISHANPSLWREVGRINNNPYVGSRVNFTVDCNTEYNNSRFRIRATNTYGVTTDPISVNIKITAVNFNSSFVPLNNRGVDLSVSKFLPMTSDWDLYVGDLFSTNGATLAIKAIQNGNVGIGTTNPTSKLTVAGNINSREVKVSVDAGADFVFEKDYTLPSLQEVEKFVTENKHLPEIASAKEMQKEGINLSEMNIKLLQKIEELTLYVIEQNKRIELLEKKNK
jgi:hypothetical protein